MVLVLALATMGSMVAQPPADVEWRPVSRTAGAEIFVDPASLRRDGSTFTIRERLVLDQVTHDIQSMIVVVRFDCVRRTHMLVHQTQMNQEGRVIFDADVRNPSPRDAVAGSPADTVLGLFCPR